MSAAGVSLGLNAALFMRARPVAGVTTAAAAAAAVVVAARCGRVRLAGRVAPWRVQQARRKSSFAPRVGKAVEPSVQWDGSKVADRTDRGETPEDVEEAEAEAEEEEEDKHLAPSKTTPNTPPQTKSIVKLVENQDQDPSVEEELVEEEEEEEEAGPRSHKLDPQIPIEEAAGKTSSSPGPSTTTTTSPKDWEGDVGALDQSTRQLRDAAKHSGPLEAVLQMESPQQVARQHPAMSPPPYTHHFDTYSLVKQLQDGGYSANQAVEAMKGIRALLAQNLDMAQESLVSKSDVENETYLFRAACSELGQEIKNNRRLQDEQVRQQRTLLQHEVDILTQSLNQEALNLNDNVRGMFNDRRMTVREEQKNADSSIQQINYKISTHLVSDSKSEIEAVRWVLIRRSALGIFFMAMLTLATVRYATYVSKKRQRELAQEIELEERVRRDGGKRDNSSAADAAVILAAN